MRALLLVPLSLLLACAGGFTVCLVLGIAPHERELLAAGLTCLLAGELAVIPIILTRGASQLAVVQAALIGTVVHLFVCVLAATVLTFARVVAAHSYLCWML